jgi:NAD+ kinase
LTERDREVVFDSQSARKLGRLDLVASNEQLAGCDLLVTLGGDGTILAASRIAALAGTPILGVHMGQFGFIAEAHPADLLPVLDLWLEGRLEVEERMMVRVEVLRDGEPVWTSFGLNEVALGKGAMARTLQVQTEFAGGDRLEYTADGVLVATPTGSTGYALSAGGPILSPTVEALVLAPVCAHTLSARPIVLPSDETITLTVLSDSEEVLVTADSAEVFPVLKGDRIVVRQAEFVTRLLHPGPSSFYRKIRKRLLWGERLNA